MNNKNKKILTFHGWKNKEEEDYWKAKDCSSGEVLPFVIFVIVAFAISYVLISSA